MSISSRTPEGPLHRCPICGERTAVELSVQEDACCPACGQLLWWFRDRLKRETLDPNLEWVADLGFDSLDSVELVMELEEEFSLPIPDEDTGRIRTVADAIRYIRERGRFKRP